MPSMVVWLLSAALARAPTPERIVFWNEPGPTSHEQALVRHMLMQTLAADASLAVLSNTQVAPREARAAELVPLIRAHLARGREALEGLHVDRARVEAAKARQKAQRVAVLTGNTLPLEAALELLAASLLLEHELAADAVLEELLLLAPHWRPRSTFFHPDAHGRVERLRQRLAQTPRRPLRLTASDERAALFVNGTRVGFGRAQVAVPEGLPHACWALSPEGQHTATRIVAGTTPLGEAPEPIEVHLNLGEGGRTPGLPAARLASAVAASRSQQLTVSLDARPLCAMGVRRVLVLERQHDQLVLTHLRLQPTQRWRVRAAAASSTLREAHDAALQLLEEPPPLQPPPAPASASGPP